MKDLLKKYNVPVPRYTSYPTVPYWEENPEKGLWKSVFQQEFERNNRQEGISLYIHLPFCESLCTYCGCTKKITTNHSVEPEYIRTILQEWDLYLSLMQEKPVIREIHLGGGTPTFFSPAHLTLLLESIFSTSVIHPDHEFSIEGHPNNTTPEHLRTLYDLGFRRISYGVQDNDPEVQRIINRIQPVEHVQQATDNAREAGFQSVNFDLIYGLPLQNMQRMEKTLLQSIAMKPDRIAFYSYAHVPWTSRGQRLFDENDLPSPDLKMELYQLGKQLFTEHGYTNIGMDHFALQGDALHKAHAAGKLHRNFMGYTTQETNMLIGLGMSAISDAGKAFVQNEKSLHQYTASIANKDLAIFKGYFLNEEDLSFRKYILDVSCRGITTFRENDLPALQEFCFEPLQDMENDGLLVFNEEQIQVTPLGFNFLRNICSAFDLKLHRRNIQSGKQVFSNAV